MLEHKCIETYYSIYSDSLMVWRVETWLVELNFILFELFKTASAVV